jgi:protease I
MRKALIIIAKDGYQDRELDGTRKGLSGSFEMILASTENGTCTGKYGGTEEAEIALKDVDIADYDRIIFIGGPGAGALANEPEALRIAHETVRANKVLGAICIAPTILAKARVLEGRNATVWNKDGEKEALLTQYGAIYTGDDVTVDGMIVTANGEEAAEEFGKTVARM